VGCEAGAAELPAAGGGDGGGDGGIWSDGVLMMELRGTMSSSTVLSVEASVKQTFGTGAQQPNAGLQEPLLPCRSR
jgi:hypothetical protein